MIVITLDGLRPQELFTGADNKLIGEGGGVRDILTLRRKFWRGSAKASIMACARVRARGPSGW